MEKNWVWVHVLLGSLKLLIITQHDYVCVCSLYFHQSLKTL